MPAWLELDDGPTTGRRPGRPFDRRWPSATRVALLERAALLGLPVARVGEMQRSAAVTALARSATLAGTAGP